jgi:prolyl-tRNA synthetase
MSKVATPGRTRCEDVAELLDIPVTRTVKAIAVILSSPAGGAGQFALILLRGDHNLNELKVQKTLGEFRFARDDEIVDKLGCQPGYIGPVGVVDLPIFADRSVAVMGDFVCGANEAGFHLTGVNFGAMSPSRRESAISAMSLSVTCRPTAGAGWSSAAASRWATFSSCVPNTPRR